VERPPVNIFSSSVVFSVCYGLSLRYGDSDYFSAKQGYFFNVSGTLDLITGENSKRLRKQTTAVFAASFANPAFGHAQGAPGHRPQAFYVLVSATRIARARVQIWAQQALRVQAPVGKPQKPRIS
jgi:hypothetical protein